MSGGHFEYEEYDVRDIVNNFANDRFMEENLSELAVKMKDISEWIFLIMHEVDYCISGDTVIQDTIAYEKRMLEKLKRIL